MVPFLQVAASQLSKVLPLKIYMEPPTKRQSISKGNVILQRILLNHIPDSVFFRLYCFFDEFEEGR